MKYPISIDRDDMKVIFCLGFKSALVAYHVEAKNQELKVAIALQYFIGFEEAIKEQLKNKKIREIFSIIANTEMPEFITGCEKILTSEEIDELNKNLKVMKEKLGGK